jgi:hypothetical protein
MITLMAFSVNRSNMGRDHAHVSPTYQGWMGVCGAALTRGKTVAAAGNCRPDFNNSAAKEFRLFASGMGGNPHLLRIV